MSTPRICIVSHAAFRALTGSTTGHIGGVEHQTSLLAKWLVARGYAVDFVTWREGEEAEAMVDGVRLLTVCRQDEGLPGLRFVFPRWTSLIAALRRSDADVYYHNTAECVTGQVGLWCRAANRRFVFSAASHADCDATLPCLPRLRERVLYRLGLRLASAAVVQTEMQRQMMQSNFARASEVIPMPCPEPDPAACAPAVGGASVDARAVGRPPERPQAARTVPRGRAAGARPAVRPGGSSRRRRVRQPDSGAGEAHPERDVSRPRGARRHGASLSTVGMPGLHVPP